MSVKKGLRRPAPRAALLTAIAVPVDETEARVIPDAETWARLHRAGFSLPVYLDFADPGWDPAHLVAGIDTLLPVYLFETPGGPADLERRSFLAWDPEWELVLRQRRLETRIGGERAARVPCADPLVELRARLSAEGAQSVPYGDGFSGGLAGYIAYDFKNHLERLPDRVRDDLGTPELRLGFVRRVVSWDHRARRVRLCVQFRCRSTRAATDRTRALAALEELREDVRRAFSARPARPVPPRRGRAGAPDAGGLRSNLERAAYDAMLARALEHILAGDIYQANLSHRFEAGYRGSGLDLYRRLRAINPSPFATYLRFPEHEVVSCSPERLVRLERGRVETRPIAGTRPRAAAAHLDRHLERELLGSEKERAEHLMIVDMARNDIGRVCELGSVAVEDFMTVERYSHVRHLVSTVAGRLRADRDGFDLLAAVFPGASITGVPKVRCMQIIDALETVRRGVYTGSAGYFGLDGSVDLNILIRTFLLQGGRAYFHVGGGIVADSEPESEYRETLAKARALCEALQAARSRPRRETGDETCDSALTSS
jgi:anthranilate/para-aminobenzoate synthase component I